jgi:hypothetical protein
MCTSKGEFVAGLRFFELLCAGDRFCAELGRTVLAAGRLESALKRHLAANVPTEDTTKATLGKLIQYCKINSLIAQMIPALEVLRDQRNYLTHNIHALLSDLIEETILERADLLDSDVVTYAERAWELKNNLNGLAEIVERECGT